jgi:DNA-binding response OmpR family regulator
MLRPIRVLIVDDDRDNREAYAEYLRFRGFLIDEADTGAKAVEQVMRLDPDLVLLDLRLPDIDGAEVSRRLRARADRPRIIALSACVFNEDIATALASGCDHFIAKPCLPETLEAEVIRMLDSNCSKVQEFKSSRVRGLKRSKSRRALNV